MSCACHWPDDPAVRRAVQQKQAEDDAQREWDITFLEMADLLARRRSKDPSTKVGAVIVSPNGKTIVSFGYNGFARGMNDDPALYADRETKYSRIIHAEMNAVLNAGKSVDGCTLYTSKLPPCDRCAVFMIQAGIRRVVYENPAPEIAARWADSLAKTEAMFAEVGIPMIGLTLPKE